MGIQLNGTSGTDIISAVDGSLTVEGLNVSGNFNITGNILGTQDQTFIGANTSDGSDNKSVMLGGGGSTSVNRGAYVWAKGNEYSGAGGELVLSGGAVSSALIDFYTNSGQRARITSTGELNIGGSYTQTTNKLNVTGTAYVSSDITAGDDIIAADEIRNNVPGDFWASDNTFISLNGYGNLTHLGGYQTCLTSNGYRTSTSAQWKSYAANSTTGAAQIRLDPTGYISFGTESNKSNGSTWVVTERLRITSNGRVNIGTGELDQTDRMLNVYGGRARISGIPANSNSFEVYASSTTGQSHGILVQAGTNSSDINATFRNTSGATLLKIVGDGAVNIGGAAYSIWNTLAVDQTPRVQIRCTVGQPAGMALLEERGDANCASFIIGKSRYGNGVGAITSGDHLGLIKFAGADGTRQHNAAGILAYSSGTIATGRVAGNLAFYTAPDSVSSMQTRLLIDSAGRVQCGDESGSNRTSHAFQISDISTGSSYQLLSLQNHNNSNNTHMDIGFYAQNANSATVEYARIEGTAVGTYANSNQEGAIKMYTNKAGTMGEVFKIDKIGNTWMTGSNNGQKVHYFKNMDTTSSSSSMTVEHHFNFNRTGGGVDLSAARIIAGKEREWVGGAANQDGYLAFHTAWNESSAEKMRIMSDGTLLIGTTSAGNTGSYFQNDGNDRKTLNVCSSSTAAQNQIIFRNSNGRVGHIQTNGTSTSYNTTFSDRAAKKNFENWNEDVLNLFKSINPQKFNLKVEDDSASKSKGFIAQEMVDKFPEAYQKEEGDLYQFNPSGMVVYLMKALQEEIAKREALETRIAALESS